MRGQSECWGQAIRPQRNLIFILSSKEINGEFDTSDLH